MNTRSASHDLVERPCAVSIIDSLCRSLESALLSESQQDALNKLCDEVRELGALDREDDAWRTLKVAIGLLTGGPPCKD